MEVAFEDLEKSKLVVDTIYKGGKVSGKGSEVLSKLLPGCSNSGGFRKVLRKDGSGLPAYVVLYTFNARVGLAGLPGRRNRHIQILRR